METLLAIDISHDIIAAFIGAVALVLVATLPLLWRKIEQGRQEDRENRVDLISLRERLDYIANIALEGQERRRAEHEELKRMLRDHLDRERWKNGRNP